MSPESSCKDRNLQGDVDGGTRRIEMANEDKSIWRGGGGDGKELNSSRQSEKSTSSRNKNNNTTMDELFETLRNLEQDVGSNKGGGNGSCDEKTNSTISWRLYLFIEDYYAGFKY